MWTKGFGGTDGLLWARQQYTGADKDLGTVVS